MTMMNPKHPDGPTLREMLEQEDTGDADDTAFDLVRGHEHEYMRKLDKHLRTVRWRATMAIVFSTVAGVIAIINLIGHLLGGW